MRWFRTLLPTLAVTLVSAASAQDQELETRRLRAEKLFQQALEIQRAGDADGAKRLIQQAQQLLDQAPRFESRFQGDVEGRKRRAFADVAQRVNVLRDRIAQLQKNGDKEALAKAEKELERLLSNGGEAPVDPFLARIKNLQDTVINLRKQGSQEEANDLESQLKNMLARENRRRKRQGKPPLRLDPPVDQTPKKAIKSQTSANLKDEVVELREQVDQLSNRVLTLTKRINQLTDLLEKLLAERRGEERKVRNPFKP